MFISAPHRVRSLFGDEIAVHSFLLFFPFAISFVCNRVVCMHCDFCWFISFPCSRLRDALSHAKMIRDFVDESISISINVFPCNFRFDIFFPPKIFVGCRSLCQTLTHVCRTYTCVTNDKEYVVRWYERQRQHRQWQKLKLHDALPFASDLAIENPVESSSHTPM